MLGYVQGKMNANIWRQSTLLLLQVAPHCSLDLFFLCQSQYLRTFSLTPLKVLLLVSLKTGQFNFQEEGH